MSRLIVHIGTHKTGTTSIQKTLAFHRQSLGLSGILYPDYEIAGLGSSYAHISMANALAGHHQRYKQEDAEAFFASVRDHARNANVTILSAEPFYRQTLGSKRAQKITDRNKYWKVRERYVARVRSAVGPAEIAIVLRRQDNFAESIYQEQVKVTRYADTFENYLKQFWFLFTYLEQIKIWEKYFDKVHIIPFQTIVGTDITRRFLALLDVGVDDLAERGLQNKGMPHEGVLLKRRLNSTLRDTNALRRMVSAISSDHFRHALKPGARSFFASEAERRAFLDGFSAENAEIARMAGLEGGALFGTGFSEDVIYGDVLDPAEDARLEGVLEAAIAPRPSRLRRIMKRLRIPSPTT